MLKSSSLCLYTSNLGTFWLKIEQFWPFEEISIFSNGGHLGYRTVLTDTILKGDHLRIISACFFFILILFISYFGNYLEIDVKFIAKMCSMSRSTYPAIWK
jgi:hypothetical protein